MSVQAGASSRTGGIEDPRFVCERTVGMVSLRFSWDGELYIEVSRPRGPAKELIGVWNYETSRPTIGMTLPDFEDRVDRWISDYPEEELALHAMYW